MENTALFLCGSVAGMVTSCVVQPLDVIKTNVLTINKPMTISKSFRFVYNQYGPSGFWRGLRPAAYKSFLGSGCSFFLMEKLKSMISQTNSKASQFLHDSIVAILSRTLTSLALSPLSVIKVRMEAPQANPYKNVWDGIQHIYMDEGFKGYYRGIGAALLRDLPFSALAYSLFNQYYRFLQKFLGNSSFVSMISGGMAGFTATLITQPFDIIKTRKQFAYVSGNAAFDYKSIFHAFKTIYQTEGMLGFTTGLNIRIVERSIAFSSVWYIFDTLKRKYVYDRPPVD